ncbi:MAG: hypothetical protein J6Y25_03840 [Elusimicrobiaceae bacterium]|nr:hypothetical protein [Elusimicrobiaceae bacterium]
MLLSKKVFFLCILCSSLPVTVQAQSEIIKSAAIRTAKETETALNIWTAWNKGYYILYQPGQRVLFLQGIGKPLFTSPYQVESHSSTR